MSISNFYTSKYALHFPLLWSARISIYDVIAKGMKTYDENFKILMLKFKCLAQSLWCTAILGNGPMINLPMLTALC